MTFKSLPAEAFPAIFPPREIRVLGAGRFGRMAAQRLKRRFPDALLCVIDRDTERIERIGRELEVAVRAEDSIRAITERPVPGHVWLIPAVPVHVGYQWILHELGALGPARGLAVPEEADPQVPHPIRSGTGTLYASFATFLCPDHCSEPEEICTQTGKARPGNLYEVLGRIRVPGYAVEVLRSWQLAPGVGGYPAVSLADLLARIGARPGKYLIGTSCRCHGVVDGLEWEAPA